jgi:hypothetical protein
MCNFRETSTWSERSWRPLANNHTSHAYPFTSTRLRPSNDGVEMVAPNLPILRSREPWEMGCPIDYRVDSSDFLTIWGETSVLFAVWAWSLGLSRLSSRCPSPVLPSCLLSLNLYYPLSLTTNRCGDGHHVHSLLQALSCLATHQSRCVPLTLFSPRLFSPVRCSHRWI